MDLELDYDDIISQNVISKDESTENPKRSRLSPNQHDTNSFPVHLFDENMHNFLLARRNEPINPKEYKKVDSSPNSDDSDSEELPREVFMDSDVTESSSSDGEWASAAKKKRSKTKFQCDQCDKKCLTKRGLDLHKRSHNPQRRSKSKSLQEDERLPANI